MRSLQTTSVEIVQQSDRPYLLLHQFSAILHITAIASILSDWTPQLSTLPDFERGSVDRLEVRAKNILNEGSIMGSADADAPLFSHLRLDC